MIRAEAPRPESRHPRPDLARTRPASGSGSQAGSEEAEPEIKVYTFNLDPSFFDVNLDTDLVSELGAGLGHEGGVNPGVEAAPGVNTERVTLLRTRASQHGDQPAGKMYILYLGSCKR